jgi:hypothetical protein
LLITEGAEKVTGANEMGQGFAEELVLGFWLLVFGLWSLVLDPGLDLTYKDGVGLLRSKDQRPKA